MQCDVKPKARPAGCDPAVWSMAAAPADWTVRFLTAKKWWCNRELINIDPENHQFFMVSLVFQPPSARVYVNLPEGNREFIGSELSSHVVVVAPR